MGYQLTWFNKPYLLARLGLWLCIATVALVDNILHRKELPAGWQLHRAISAVLAIFIVQEVSTSAFNGTDDMYDYLIVVYNVAEATFLGLLLLVSTGWKITRDTLDGRRLLFFFPPVHCVCSLIVDFILDKRVGHENNEAEVAYIPDATERTVLIVANLASLVTLLYAWWWIFACLAAERKQLRQRIEARASGALSDSENDSDDGTTGLMAGDDPGDPGNPETFARIDLNSDDDDEEEEVFDARATASSSGVVYQTNSHLSPRGDSLSEAENGYSDSPEATASGSTTAGGRRRRRRRRQRHDPQLSQQLLSGRAELDDINITAASTADYGIPDKAKLRLLDQYSILVQTYLFTYLLIILINAWNQDRPPATIVILDVCNMLILAGLLYVFRLRTTNPYYILPETLDEDYGGEYTGGIGGADYEPPATDDWAARDLAAPSAANDDDGNIPTRVVANATFEIGSDDDDDDIDVNTENDSSRI